MNIGDDLCRIKNFATKPPAEEIVVNQHFGEDFNLSSYKVYKVA